MSNSIAIQDNTLDNTPCFDVEKMLGNENTAKLILGSQVYILRKTRQDKLLLTK